MSRVATYSQPFIRSRGFLSGLGQDSTDVFSTTYDPLASTPSASTDLGVPYANEPAWTPPAPLPLAPDQATFNANPYAYSGIAAGGEAGASPQNFQAATGYTSPSVSPTTGSAIISALTSAITPRPSPVVNVPLSTSTVGMWASNNMGTIAVVVIGAVVLSSVLGGKRRRR